MIVDFDLSSSMSRSLPVHLGLILAADGLLIDDLAARSFGARRYLGWSNERHWLLTEPCAPSEAWCLAIRTLVRGAIVGTLSSVRDEQAVRSSRVSHRRICEFVRFLLSHRQCDR